MHRNINVFPTAAATHIWILPTRTLGKNQRIVVNALVNAIGLTVSVSVDVGGIGIGDTASTDAWARLFSITRATVLTIECSVSIRIGIGDSTTTNSWLVFVGIITTTITFACAQITKDQADGNRYSYWKSEP